jgi:surfactin synthase thioesterase subunit
MMGQPVRCRLPRPHARVRLVCFPHSGGGLSSFAGWESLFGPHVEIWRVLLPGRGSRGDEPPAREWDPLVAELAAAVQVSVPRPYALFGHSIGATIAFEVARVLGARGMPPLHLAVSARPAPHIPNRLVVPANDDDLLRQVDEVYQGVPEQVRAAPDLLRYFLHLIRADLELSVRHEYRPGPPLGVPMTAFGGDSDPTVTPADLRAWERHTTEGCPVHVLPGGHFYLAKADRDVADILRRAVVSEGGRQ